MKKIGIFLLAFSLISIGTVFEAKALKFNEIWLPVNEVQDYYSSLFPDKTYKQIFLPQLEESATESFNSSSNFVKSSSFNTIQDYTDVYVEGDIMAMLFAVFRDSIEQTNEDKAYFLQTLAEMNKIADAMGDYLQELNDIFGDLTDGNECGEKTVDFITDLIDKDVLYAVKTMVDHNPNATLNDLNLILEDNSVAIRLSDDMRPPPVPEPATILLLGTGLVGIVCFRKKFKKR